ncbi:urease accessory protein UreD [Methyloterricola oryzae]|uniref:urease accessory protein UreD n=1 Tax=Methyloterricola oryzae TaxID=1495050 RepID=UPI0005EBB5C4|nr:urease accessory protein UreD [Methyloterricola oryzae]
MSKSACASPSGVDGAADRTGWEAVLDLRLGLRGGRTVLTERGHRGPLQVQRPFYPEGATAHVYLLHPPGGVVGGDQLSIHAMSEVGSEALLTTPAAGKFYRSEGALARQVITLEVAAGAALEWLPQETLMFDGARLDSRLNIAVEEGARFIGWDLIGFGRPASGDYFNSGAGQFRVAVRQSGRPLLLENFPADAEFLQASWGLRGGNAMATLLATPFDKSRLGEVHALLQDDSDFGATLLDELLVVRAMGSSLLAVRERFEALWTLIRPQVLGQKACPPRIWAT